MGVYLHVSVTGIHYECGHDRNDFSEETSSLLQGSTTSPGGADFEEKWSISSKYLSLKSSRI